MHQETVFRITGYLTPIGIGLHAACVGFFLKRRSLREEYPFLFSYLIFQTITSLVFAVFYYRIYFLHVGSYKVYFYSYWVQGIVSDLLSLAVFKELFSAALKHFRGLRDLANVLFRWAALALLLIGVIAVVSSSMPAVKHIAALFLNLERTLHGMQCAFLIFLFVGSTYLGLSRRSHVFGLALGFGTLAASILTLDMAVSLYGYAHVVSLKLLPPVAFAIGPAIWTFYLAGTEPARDIVNVPVASPLMRWNEVAMAFGHSGGRVAFIEDPEPFVPEPRPLTGFTQRQITDKSKVGT